MTESNFRALCVELVDIATAHCHPDDDAVGYCAAVLSRARAALEAQPEPQGFTPDHVNLMCFAFEREPWATWLRRGGCLESAHCELSDLMLAVLARWGRPAIEPVSVSERPQGPTDEELCKFFRANDDLMRHCEAGTDWDEPLMTEYEFPAVARAVLARWGRPAIEPVSVSERLPGPQQEAE